MDESVLQFRHL